MRAKQEQTNPAIARPFFWFFFFACARPIILHISPAMAGPSENKPMQGMNDNTKLTIPQTKPAIETPL
jgi:hypothetical protein